MVHAAVAEAQPGEVLVLTMPEPRAGRARRRAARDAGEGPRRRGDRSSTRAVRDVEELRRARACRSGRAACACAAPTKQAPRRDRRAGGGRRRDDPPGRRRRARRRRRRRGRARARRRGAGRRASARASGSATSAPSCRQARSPTTSTACGRSSRSDDERCTTSPGSATPSCSRRSPRRACASSSTCSGWRSEAREGQSVYLRGWGDYLRYSLKLTECRQAGLAHMALRAWSPEALERRVAAIEATGLGAGWIDGDVGHGPGVPLHRSRRPRVRALLRGRALRRRPSTCSRRGGTSPSATSAAAPRSSGSTTSTCSPPTSRASRVFCPGAARLPPVRADRARRRHRGGRAG